MKFLSPMRRHEVLAGMMNANDYKTFVEVGCKEGRLAGHILKHVPGSRVVAIDPWRAVPNDDEDYSTWDYAAIEKEFWSNVEGHAGRLEFLRMTSLEAAAKVAGPFDLVFIDAAHDEANVLADIRAWWPLVKQGGVLAGHDYQHKFPGTMRAVAASFPLIHVGVMPDSVWMVPKMPNIELRAA